LLNIGEDLNNRNHRLSFGEGKVDEELTPGNLRRHVTVTMKLRVVRGSSWKQSC